MNWIYFSIITGITFGLQTSLLKYASKYFPKEISLSTLFLGAALILLPKFIYTFQIISLQTFLVALLISFIVNIFAFKWLTMALQVAPLSIVAPFLNLTPLFIFVSGWLILGEIITLNRAFAIIVIVVGCILIQIPILKKNTIINPGYIRGLLMALAVSFLWSISASFEKIAVINSSVYTYAFLIHLLLGLYFLLKFKGRAVFIKSAITHFRKRPHTVLIVLAITTAVMAYTQYTAITLTSVSSVIAIKRAGVLVSTLIGFIYFKEKNYASTVSGTLIILAGIYALSLPD